MGDEVLRWRHQLVLCELAFNTVLQRSRTARDRDDGPKAYTARGWSKRKSQETVSCVPSTAVMGSAW